MNSFTHNSDILFFLFCLSSSVYFPLTFFSLSLPSPCLFFSNVLLNSVSLSPSPPFPSLLLYLLLSFFLFHLILSFFSLLRYSLLIHFLPFLPFFPFPLTLPSISSFPFPFPFSFSSPFLFLHLTPILLFLILILILLILLHPPLLSSNPHSSSSTFLYASSSSSILSPSCHSSFLFFSLSKLEKNLENVKKFCSNFYVLRDGRSTIKMCIYNIHLDTFEERERKKKLLQK